MLGRLPLPVLYGLSTVIAFVLSRLIGYRRKVVFQNLRNSFPEESEESIRKYASDFYRRFTDYAVETLHMVSMDLEDIQKHCQVSWDPQLDAYVNKKQPVLILTSHIFNWEWTLHAFRGVTTEPYAAVYQRLTHAKFDEFMYGLRTKTGGMAIEKSQIMRFLAKNRNNMPGLVMLADQSPMQGTKKYWTKFLNQETAFFLGPEMIAYSTGMPIFFYRVSRIKRGKYNIHIEHITEAPKERGDLTIIKRYAEALEKAIREDPPAYLWSHKRWKLKPAATSQDIK